MPTTNEEIKTIIVDDLDADRFNLKELLKTHKEINIIAEEGNAKEGLETILSHQPDLVFLDIKMEDDDSGIQLAKQIRNKLQYNSPIIIFMTSYIHEDIEGIVNIQPLGYIKKPVEQEDIDYFINAVKAEINNKKDDDDRFPEIYTIPSENSIHVINPKKDILYITSQTNFPSTVEVYLTDDRIIVTRRLLKDFTEDLQYIKVCQTHRSFLANLNKFQEIEAFANKHLIILKGTAKKIPLANNYKKSIMKKLGM